MSARRPTLLLWVLPLALWACAEEPNILSAKGETGEPEVEIPDAGPVNIPDREVNGAECQIGEEQSCSCQGSDGNMTDGVRTCVDTSGVWTECSCTKDWPWLGETCSNGAEEVECLPLAGEVTEFSGDHCCTDEGKCGLGNPDAFGTDGFLGDPVCVERYSNPEGMPTEQCGETVIPFVETSDCCRPDGQCGLYLEQGNNWEDLGCIERTQLAEYLKNNDTLAFFLTVINGTPDALENIEKKSCTYGE